MMGKVQRLSNSEILLCLLKVVQLFILTKYLATVKVVKTLPSMFY
jgi:hypothetical protein